MKIDNQRVAVFQLDTLAEVGYIHEIKTMRRDLNLPKIQESSIHKENLTVFSEFTDREFSRFARFLQLRYLAANQIIYQQSTLAVAFYIIQSGSAALQRTIGAGKMDRLALIKPGQALAIDALGANENRHTETAITLEACTLLALTRQDFLMLEKAMPMPTIKLVRSVLQQVGRQWLEAKEEYHALAARLTKANILL